MTTQPSPARNQRLGRRQQYWIFVTAFAFVSLGRCFGPAADSHRVVTVTGTPQFEQRGEWTCFIVTNAEHTCRLWGLGRRSAVPGVSLDTNRVYDFVFTTEPFTNFSELQLIKVRLDGKTLYDFETCEIHHLKMERKSVRIIYGLVRPRSDEPSFEIDRELFPHRHEVALGGCSPGPNETAEIYVCASCKAAYAKWKQDRTKGK